MDNETKRDSSHQGGGTQGTGQSGSQYEQNEKRNREQGKNPQSEKGASQFGKTGQEQAGSGAFKCDVCGQVFNSEEERRSHQSTQHDRAGKSAGQSGR